MKKHIHDKVGCLYVVDFPNGKSYYGITSRGLRQRITEHRQVANTYGRWAISKAFALYQDWFIAEVLVVAPMWYLDELEPKVIEAFRSRVPHGYNQAPGGSIAPAKTEETRLLLSRLKLGTRHSEETKAKLRKAWEARPRGWKWSEEERARREANRNPVGPYAGKRHNPEVREKIRQASLAMWAKRKQATHA